MGRAYLIACLCLAAASADAATLEGTVRDAQGHTCATASVHLETQAGVRLTAHTDGSGAYHFTELLGGSYVLRAESKGQGAAAVRPVTLGDGETKRVDLTVEYALYDEPHFIVAGVTDPVARGGHGSDTVLRSSEALAKAAAALGGAPGSGAEQPGDALKTVREYQRAAELDASEVNLFRWGAELLIHGAAEPATEVFGKGHRTFPQSVRMLLGLATAWYARADYGRAAQLFFDACDLNPDGAGPYLFLGKIQSSEVTQLAGYVDRLGRFARLYPDNAWANYYYAVGLWKQRTGPEDSATAARVLALLEKAVSLDPVMGIAYLQLGIVYSDLNDDALAVAAYRRAIEAGPETEEAHYRLGLVYGRMGLKAKAREELELYERLSRKSQEEVERERRGMQQFVYELR